MNIFDCDGCQANKAEAERKMKPANKLGWTVRRKQTRCRCNNASALLCHECEEATGVCYCKCHDAAETLDAIRPV